MGTVQSLGRFQLITNSSPPVAPGKCVVCGATSSDNSYIDFGFDLDFYGVVYFCNRCIIEIARLLGFIPPEQWQVILDHNMESDNYIGELEKKNKELMDVVHNLSKLVGSNSIAVTLPPGVDVEFTEQGPQTTGNELVTVNTESPEREDGSLEQVNESGSPDVSNNDGDDFDDLISRI